MGSHICPHLRSALWMFGILALSAGRAHAALTITVGDVTIVDQGAGDASDTLSVIKFDVSGAGYRARGTLLQQLPTAVTPASLVLTDTLVSQVGDPGGANVTITVTSDIFNPFFPTTMLAAHLDGLYVKVDELGDVLPPGDDISAAHIRFQAFAGPPGSEALFAEIVPAVAFGVPSNVAFGPTVVTGERRFMTNIDLHGILIFRVGTGDGILLPTSAAILASPVPEPASGSLVGLGLATVLLARRRQLESPRR